MLLLDQERPFDDSDCFVVVGTGSQMVAAVVEIAAQMLAQMKAEVNFVDVDDAKEGD